MIPHPTPATGLHHEQAHQHRHDHHTLILLGKPDTRVIEVTPKGKVVWELEGLGPLLDADRLPNGHTLVGRLGEVAEYDAKGKKVWSAKVTGPVEVNRY